MIRLILLLSIILNFRTYAKCMSPRHYRGKLSEVKDILRNDSNPLFKAKEKLFLVNILEHIKNYGDSPKNVTSSQLQFELDSWKETKGEKSLLELDLAKFRESIIEMTSRSVNWSKLRQTDARNEFINNKEEYLSAIGESRYLRAIFYLSIGEEQQAISTLHEEFSIEYQNTLKARSIGGLPCQRIPQFYWLHKVYKPLEVLSTGEKLKAVKEKYKKAELYISNLPRIMILT